MLMPQENSLLIADPFLKDENFMRSVIFLCNHDEEGSFGLKLTETFEFTLNQLFNDLEHCPLPVYVGGPVATDTIHFLHLLPELIPDSQLVGNGLYWGGDFAVVKSLLSQDKIDCQKIKFFIGYSGWSKGQLENEMNEKTWLTTAANQHIVFDIQPGEVWKESVKLLGDDFLPIIHYPIDPQLN